ncbi:MAG: glycosyltransferase [Pirellulales bacterium]|nr:glycosyltransferase [Pirellulales bacterium]
MTHTVIVIPCFNEARRLHPEAFVAFVASGHPQHFLFVNDGSTDDTARRLDDLASRVPQCQVLHLPANVGKAEAVRQGLLAALGGGAVRVGFLDADLATPLEALPELAHILDVRPDIEWVFGSRVRLLGRTIERRRARHYLGRVFATAVSLLLGLPIYDTQCGAKLFRGTDELRRLLATPFTAGWIFDVELIARLIQARRGTNLPPPEACIYELPLQTWRDVAGSKLRAKDFLRASLDLLKIKRKYLASPPRMPRSR